MKKQPRALNLGKLTIRPLTPHESAAAVGGLFEQDRPFTFTIGVSGPPPQASDTCSWGCSHTCSNYATCA